MRIIGYLVNASGKVIGIVVEAGMGIAIPVIVIALVLGTWLFKELHDSGLLMICLVGYGVIPLLGIAYSLVMKEGRLIAFLVAPVGVGISVFFIWAYLPTFNQLDILEHGRFARAQRTFCEREASGFSRDERCSSVVSTEGYSLRLEFVNEWNELVLEDVDGVLSCDQSILEPISYRGARHFYCRDIEAEEICVRLTFRHEGSPGSVIASQVVCKHISPSRY